MTAKRKALILAALAALAVCVFVFFISENLSSPAPNAVTTEPCGSCDARHQNLTRLRDRNSQSEGEAD